MPSPQTPSPLRLWLRALLICLVLVGLFAAFDQLLLYATTQPKGPRLPLDPRLIALSSSEGQRRLRASRFKHNFPALQRQLQTQHRPGYCGVASAVTILNVRAPHPPLRWTQETFFTPRARQVRSALQVSFGGMTLQQLDGLLRAHQLPTTRIHADQSDLLRFRRDISQTLSTPRAQLLVNYARKAVFQQGSGHISPLAAYHQNTDSALLMDVATYKYPPVWIATRLLWSAIDTLDSTSQKRRGYIIIVP